MEVVALTDTPTKSSGWLITQYYQEDDFTLAGAKWAWGANLSGAVAGKITRVGRTVTLNMGFATGTATATIAATLNTALPSWASSNAIYDWSIPIVTNNNYGIGNLEISTTSLSLGINAAAALNATPLGVNWPAVANSGIPSLSVTYITSMTTV